MGETALMIGVPIILSPAWWIMLMRNSCTGGHHTVLWMNDLAMVNEGNHRNETWVMGCRQSSGAYLLWSHGRLLALVKTRHQVPAWPRRFVHMHEKRNVLAVALSEKNR